MLEPAFIHEPWRHPLSRVRGVFEGTAVSKSPCEDGAVTRSQGEVREGQKEARKKERQRKRNGGRGREGLKGREKVMSAEFRK